MIKTFKDYISIIGSFTLFFFDVLKSLIFIPKRFFEIIIQIKRIGYDSVLLIIITSGFTGLVAAVQAFHQTKGYIPVSFIGVLIQKSTMLELAPVLTGLVLAGKVGGSLAAELGSMKITEQIDALETMAINPTNFLFMPRIVAGVITLPLLTVIANIVGLFSGYFLSKIKYNVTFNQFFYIMKAHFDAIDLWSGIIKSAFFGLVITLSACYIGNKTSGGAEGVGNSATKSAVVSSILILIMDFSVASVVLGKFA